MGSDQRDYYVRQYEAARIGRIGADRMALGLPCAPNDERGDMEAVAALTAQLATANANLDLCNAAHARKGKELELALATLNDREQELGAKTRLFRADLTAVTDRANRLAEECRAWREWKGRGAHQDAHPDKRPGSLNMEIERTRAAVDAAGDIEEGKG